jgi:DNA replication protein DnaC
LIIDDFGLKPLKGSQDEDFHEVIAERYERRSAIVNSNLDIPVWIDAFPNRILGAATVDRLRHGAYKILLEGKSYRAARGSEKSAVRLPGPYRYFDRETRHRPAPPFQIAR